jgi:predicted transposase YbfD/YdcC
LPSPRRAFPPLQTARRAERIDRACEVDKGHGRIEKRTLETTDGLAEYLQPDWPECHQVFRRERERRFAGKVEVEVVYGISSLSRARAGARALLSMTRGHWGIENGLHGVRDGTFREDASRIRKGSGPQVMAALRNIAVFLFDRSGFKSAAAATRHYVCHPNRVLDAVSIPIRE